MATGNCVRQRDSAPSPRFIDELLSMVLITIRCTPGAALLLEPDGRLRVLIPSRVNEFAKVKSSAVVIFPSLPPQRAGDPWKIRSLAKIYFYADACVSSRGFETDVCFIVFAFPNERAAGL